MAAFDSTLTKFFDSMEGIMPFQPESKALGGSKKSIKSVIKSEASTPLGDVSGFFAGIDKSLINLVNFAKESLGINKESLRLESQIADIMASDLILSEKENLVNQLKQRDRSLDGVDTDAKGDKKPILDTLKDSFQQVEFGEKMTAILMAGGLFLFLKYREQIEAALLPVVKFLMGVVDFLGVEGTLMLLLGTILTIKLLPVIKAAFDVAKYLGTFLPSFKKLKAVFRLMRFKINTQLIPGITSAYNGTATTKALKLLGFAFKGLRLMLTATLYPAIISMVTTLAAAMGPILGPIIIIGAIAAGIAAVLFSIKSGFDTFKQSLEDGDGMLLAIGKGIADFAITLATLPITLIKKLVGFIAGLFGFDDFKAKLDKFSFKDVIKNAFFGFIGSFVKVIKAIAKGAAAALAAIAPGGKTPQAEFSRVYNEIMQGGSGQSKIEKSDLEKTDTDSEPELTENEVAKAIDKGEIQAIKKGSLATMIGRSNAPDNAFDYFNDDVLDDHFADSSIKKSKLLKEQADMSKRLMIDENQNREARKSIAARQTAMINSNNNQNYLSSNYIMEADLAAGNSEGSQNLVNNVYNPPK
tara:strand:+ start:37 stop:1788 length:1752 start_codon:yes stop_codon:yes gene_type:complete